MGPSAKAGVILGLEPKKLSDFITILSKASSALVHVHARS